MRVEVVKGSKQEIAQAVLNTAGEVREAIMFVEEPAQAPHDPPNVDFFAEMDQYSVRVDHVDYSRQAIYTSVEGE